MQRYGHPLTLLQLQLLVARIIQSRYTSFKDGTPQRGWIEWFQNHQCELPVQRPQGLEIARARRLCPEVANTLYNNLQNLYNIHNYQPSYILNTDESGAKAGWQGGAHVLAKKGTMGFYLITPREKKNFFVLAYINAHREEVPSFYIFKGMHFCQNYIQDYENEATMAMQPKAWMTRFLFYNWLEYFIKNIDELYGMSSKVS
jgi:hypothetical protein